MRIGILTFFRPINYGAYLQAYALSHRLNQEDGMEAEIIDFHMPEEDRFYEDKLKLGKNIFRTSYNKKRFKLFRNQLALQTTSIKKCCSNEINVFKSFVDNKYDIIITGSDEVWQVNGFRGFPTPYFLPGDLHCKKVAYAVSGRTPFNVLNEQERGLLKEYLNDFSYIGVRDSATYREVEKIINQKSKLHLNFDPSFIYDFKPDFENGKNLLKKYFGISKDKKVIGIMFQQGVRDKFNLAKYLRKEYGNEFKFISLYEWSAFLKSSPLMTPFEWIDLISAVDGIISMYFHGICFSIICGTPFLAIEKREKNIDQSKLYDLLDRLNLNDNYILGVENALNKEKLTPFLKNVRKGRKYDYKNILISARNEFNQFVETLKGL